MRLLSDPLFTDMVAIVDERIISNLRDAEMNGDPKEQAYVLELVRMLQAGDRYQRMLSQAANVEEQTDDEINAIRGGMGLDPIEQFTPKLV